MVSIVLLFTFVYLFVIILTDDPRTTFPRLAEKLTPEQEVIRSVIMDRWMQSGEGSSVVIVAVMDGYVLRRARAMMEEVGVVAFNAILQR